MTEKYKAGDRIRIEYWVDGEVVGMLIGTLSLGPNAVLIFVPDTGPVSNYKLRLSTWEERGWTVEKIASSLPTEHGLYVSGAKADDLTRAVVLRLNEDGWRYVDSGEDATATAERWHKSRIGLVPLEAKIEEVTE